MQSISDALEVGLRVGRLLASSWLATHQFEGSEPGRRGRPDIGSYSPAGSCRTSERRRPYQDDFILPPAPRDSLRSQLTSQSRRTHSSTRITGCQSFRRWKLRARGWRRESRVVSLLNRESDRHNTMLSRAESQKTSALRLCIRGTIRLSTPVPLTPILCGFFPNPPRQCYSVLKQPAAGQLR